MEFPDIPVRFLQRTVAQSMPKGDRTDSCFSEAGFTLAVRPAPEPSSPQALIRAQLAWLSLPCSSRTFCRTAWRTSKQSLQAGPPQYRRLSPSASITTLAYKATPGSSFAGAWRITVGLRCDRDSRWLAFVSSNCRPRRSVYLKIVASARKRIAARN